MSAEGENGQSDGLGGKCGVSLLSLFQAFSWASLILSNSQEIY